MSIAVGHTVREGRTYPFSWILKTNNSAIDLSGVDHVLMVLADKDGTATSFSSEESKLDIDSETTGKVNFTPAASDLSSSKSPYRVFFWVYHTANSRYSVSSEEEELVEVTPGYST